MTHEYEVVCRQARAEARATRRDTYVVVWIDERVSWQRRIDQIDRLFARRITRIAPDGQRTVETGRLRAPLPPSA